MPTGAKTKTFHIRLTEAETRSLEHISGILGMSKADYIRLLLKLPCETNVRAGVIDPKLLGREVVVYDTVSLGKLHRELAAQGNNLNQAAKALNAIAKNGAAKGNLSGIDYNLSDIARSLADIERKLDYMLAFTAPVRKG